MSIITYLICHKILHQTHSYVFTQQFIDQFHNNIPLNIIILNIFGIVKHFFRLLYKWGGIIVISYAPFYKTLIGKNITEYSLVFKQGFSPKILHRMKHGEAITTKTLDTLCFILNCEVSDVIEHIKE